MSAIIRATERNSAVHSVAFNFDDMAARANAYLDKVRADAAQILADARRDAEGIRKNAEQQGFRAGERAVGQTVREQLGAQLETLLPALRQVINDIQHAKQTWLANWEKSGLRLATAVAERLIRRELSHTPEIPLTLIREALDMATGSNNLRIHLNPTDYDTLRPQIQTLVRECATLAETELVPDESVAPGGCRVETQFGVIDQQWETQLKRIEEELI
jgi:flagellar assembly protein FliH